MKTALRMIISQRMVLKLVSTVIWKKIRNFSTSAFLLTADRKQQFRVRGLAFGVCGLYQFNCEKKRERIVSLEESTTLNIQPTTVFDFQTETKSSISPIRLKLHLNLS